MANDDEDKTLGTGQAPQDGSTKEELDMPVSDEPTADAAAAPDRQDDQEADNPDASTKPGEAGGKKTKEQVAAEKAPTEKHDNPVGEATSTKPNSDEGHKDPYAEGKHIANPEPNNGNGEDSRDKDPTESDEPSNEEKSAKLLDDQENLEA